MAIMRPLEDSCGYIMDKGATDILFHHTQQLQEYVSGLIDDMNGLFLEFGIWCLVFLKANL